jgi:hypothetical protein
MKYVTEFSPDILTDLNIEEVKTNKKISYLNVPCAFDIETTSMIINGEKFAFSYVWQFGIGLNNTYYGRTWGELLDFLQDLQDYLGLNENKRLIIYVHNLGYEFQFMRKYFNWVNIFAVDERKPVKALCDLGIEFRDSYILSGYSLANTAKNLTKHSIAKMVGDLDYSLIRHTKTPLTETELKYCENDILVILAYIDEQLDQYQDITKIPLTNTGRVRSYVKNNCYYDNTNHRKSNKGKYIRYRKIMSDLTLDIKTYSQLKTAFMGGFTHSNPHLTGITLDDVGSIDLTSSYPSVMCAEMYPMSRPKELNPKSYDELKELMKVYCIVLEVRYTGLTNILGYESYISESKCRNIKGAEINNGRIWSADSIDITLTDIDITIIEQVYNWENIALKNVMGFRKAYLPKPIIESILNLYQDKTTLKGVQGKEVEYLLSKGMLNSVYGMSVTDIVKDNAIYDDADNWDFEKVNIDEEIEKYNGSKNRFLYYAWGIWVTAYARRNLWTGILAVGEDYIYSDTDSIKALNYDKHSAYVEAYNKNVLNKLYKMCDELGFDPTLLTPKTVKGEVKPLGIWEFEGNYNRFKTLGAKRYLVQEGDKYSLTVAGLSKANGMQYIQEVCENDSEKIFNMFNNELYIPSNKTGKMTHTYLDNEQSNKVTDYLGSSTIEHALSGVHLGACDFTLSISKQYLNFLANLKDGYIFTGLKHV